MDETLFASGNKSRQGRPRSNAGQTAYVSKEQMANLLGSDSVVMSNAELGRLKVPTMPAPWNCLTREHMPSPAKSM